MELSGWQNDHVLLPSENTLHLKPLVPTLTHVHEVPKADHWVVLARWSARLANEAGAICEDPPGVNCAQVHERADAVAFFRKALGVY